MHTIPLPMNEQLDPVAELARLRRKATGLKYMRSIAVDAGDTEKAAELTAQIARINTTTQRIVRILKAHKKEEA